MLDTHSSHAGILGESPLRPDFAICLKDRNPAALTTLGFLEVERTEAVNKLDSIGQAVSCGEALLRLLDPSLGRPALVGVTDLRTIQWVKVYMSREGHFSYQVAPSEDNARASLYAVLGSNWGSILALPTFSGSSAGGALEVQKFLGSGGSGAVYSCSMGEEVGRASCADCTRPTL